MRYKNVIWDLDGTLLDTLQDLADAVNYALTNHGMPCRTLEEIRSFVGNGVKNLVIRAVPEGELNPQFNNVFTLFRTYYLEHCQDNTRPYIGINEVLSKLKRHDIGLAIVSNKLQAGVTELNKRWFSEFIDIAIGEREGVNRKPLPDMLNIAMKELNAKAEETVYIGDSDTDILTAKNAGVQCISVLWGFRDRDFLLEHGATNFASSPKELLAMILHNE